MKKSLREARKGRNLHSELHRRKASNVFAAKVTCADIISYTI